MYVSKTTIGLENRVITLPKFYSDTDLTLTPLSQIAVNMQYFLIQHTQCILCPKAYKSMFLTEDDQLIDFFLDAYAYFEQKGCPDLILLHDVIDLDILNIDDVPSKHEEFLRFYENVDFRDCPINITYEDIECKVLYYVEEDDFVDLCFTSLLRKPYAFNSLDKSILNWFKDHDKELNLYYPPTNQMLVNLKFIASRFDFPIDDELDVLRIAIAFSDGNPSCLVIPLIKKDMTADQKKSLKLERLKFRFKLTTAHKIRVLKFFEQLHYFKEAYKRKYQNRFVRLGEQLPLHQNRTIYPRTWANYCKLRNKGKDLNQTEVINLMYDRIIS